MMNSTILSVNAAQAALTAAQQAHAAAHSPWARFRARCIVLAAEGRLQAAKEAHAERVASFSWGDHRPSDAAPSYTRPAVVLDARGRTWDRDAVNALIYGANPEQLRQMLRAIAQRHRENTARGLTRDDNGRGFFTFEADRLQAISEVFLYQEAGMVRLALRRYAGQLLEVIGERARATAV